MGAFISWISGIVTVGAGVCGFDCWRCAEVEKWFVDCERIWMYWGLREDRRTPWPLERVDMLLFGCLGIGSCEGINVAARFRNLGDN